MKKFKLRFLSVGAVFGVAALVGAGLMTGSAQSQMMAPFGGNDDVAFSKTLWKALSDANLVGPNAVQGAAYEGQEPHGAVLETYRAKVTVNGTAGMAVIKKNFGPKGVDVEKVAMGGGKLGAVTVMFKRAGYDPDNKDWFWVKYKADGSLHTNPKGMMLAGKVAKGKDKGCIACHKNAPGDNYLFKW